MIIFSKNHSLYQKLNPNQTNEELIENKSEGVSYLCLCNPNIETIKFLQSRKINFNEEDKYGSCFIHYCLNENQSKKFYKYIFENITNPNHLLRNNKTHFHNYCNKKPKVKLLKTFLVFGADPNQQNSFKETPFQYICNQYPSYEILELLLKYGADPNKPSSNQETPFHCLCKRKISLEILDLFLRNNTDLNPQDSHGRTPIHYMFENKITIKILKYLLKNGADINIQDKFNRTPFFYLCQGKSSMRQRKLLTYIRSTILKPDSYGSVKYGLTSRFLKKPSRILFKHCFKYINDINQHDIYGLTPFHFLCCENNLNKKVIKLFLTHGSNLHQEDSYRRTPFHFLCITQPNHQTLKYIVKKIHNINQKDNQKQTFLHYLCCRNPSIQNLKLFFEKGAKPMKKNNKGQTPFHFICSGNPTIETIEYFLQQDIDINQQDYKGKTSLHFLASGELSVDLITLFLKHNVNINVVDSSLKTPLHYLCKNSKKSLELFECFFLNGANINATDDLGKTPFHYLCLENPSPKYCTLFLKYGAKINKKDKLGNTPFHYYTDSGWVPCKLVLFFLQNGADPKIINKKGHTIFDHCYKNYSNYPSKIDKLKQLSEINFNCLQDDFRQFFQRKEFTDYEIKGVKFHRLLLEFRTKKKIHEISMILKLYSKTSIIQFLKWVYYDKLPKHWKHLLKPDDNNSKEKKQNLELIKIFTQLQVPLDSIKSNTIAKSIKGLYQDETSKDFTIIMKNSNQKIKVHKIILQCRTGLFRGMFLTANDSNNINKITDYSIRTYDSLNIIIKYLYTRKIDKNQLTNKIQQELNDSVNYYQLKLNCSFNYLNMSYKNSKLLINGKN
ncbi:molting protein mlt-4 [Anaeramoeba flamelloides]|uniref:Molting protein mlt-4 n=1 Tax=Anaeramoeba flamelloides TaxID=1746091 RepID=A0AAV8A5M4_9EUKA|nr:molting protein mlt-4 [Anaeramoeba flamelloides]